MTETDSPYPQAVRESFSAFLFPCHFERSEKTTFDEVNLLAHSECIQMLHSVQHDSWMGGPRFSDKLPLSHSSCNNDLCEQFFEHINRLQFWKIRKV